MVTHHNPSISCYLPFDGFDEYLLRLSNGALQDFAENVHRTLLSHGVAVQFFQKSLVSRYFVFDLHFQISDRLEAFLYLIAFLRVGRVQIEALSPHIRSQVSEAVDAQQRFGCGREHDAHLPVNGTLSNPPQSAFVS